MRLNERAFCIVLALSMFPLSHAAAEDVGWPRRYLSGGNEVIAYQPQVDSWEGFDKLRFRMAVSAKPAGMEYADFGAIEVVAETKIDHDNRAVLLTSLQKDITFGGLSDEKTASLAAIVRNAMPNRQTIVVDFDRLLPYLEASDLKPRQVTVNLEPPPIFYSSKPAILVGFMGEPQLKPIKGTNLLFAANTNWDLFFEMGASRYFLRVGEGWLTRSDLKAGAASWQVATKLPADMAKLPTDENWTEVRKHIPGKPLPNPPVVFVSTKPSELIVTQGDALVSPIQGTDLLYVSNTESDVFLHTKDSDYYLLVAGRWFRAKQLSGPWSAANRKLPDTFAAIPDDHPKRHVLASVPGTIAAKEAVVQALIPVKATVNRSEVTVTVEYKGEPKFEVIEGSQDVSYAVNTTYAVFLVNGRYYCCENGIWFVADSPSGPWSVCIDVPDALYSIPATSPYHNVTYVVVYEYDDESATVGYTSGYEGEYIVNDLVVFGAGWVLDEIYYDDWYDWRYSPCYYSYGCAARFSYYHGGFVRGFAYYGPYGGAGFAARYNPWTGTYARGAYAYGPYRAAGVATAYNPWTGTYARAGVVSGPRGTAARGAVYNPRTGRGAATRQVNTPYGSWGRSVVTNGDDWARFGHKSGPAGKTAGFRTSEGGGGVVRKGKHGWTYAGKTPDGDIYAGHNGKVYKRGEDNNWQERNNQARDWRQPTWKSDSAANNNRRANDRDRQRREDQRKADERQRRKRDEQRQAEDRRKRENQRRAEDRRRRENQRRAEENRRRENSRRSMDRDSRSRRRGSSNASRNRSSRRPSGARRGGGGGRRGGGRRR